MQTSKQVLSLPLLSCRKYVVLSVCALFFALLSGCSTAQNGAPSSTLHQASSVGKVVPKDEEYSRHGNPASYVVMGKRYYVLKTAKGYDKTGTASWYGTKFHGKLTSSREPYDMYAMTAASPNLPIPSYVHVTNLNNGKSVVVKVNDRGPFKSDRVIDLSYAAAKELGYLNNGTAKVRVTGIDATNQKTLFASQQKHQNAVKAHAAGKAPADTQTTVLAQSTTRPVYLQVGAFKAKDRAESMSKQVSSLTSVDASVKTARNEAGPIYLVKLGPIVDGKTSNQVQAVLAQNGFEKPVEVGG